MSTVIFLSNQGVRAIVGSVRGKKVVVERAYHAQAPSGCMNNGQIIKEEEFGIFIEEFISYNKISKKNVTIVFGSGKEVNRNIRLPRLSDKQTLRCIAREFASVECTKTPVYGYTVLSDAKEKSREVIASMVERNFLEPHLARTKVAKAHVTSVTMALEARMALFVRLSCLKEGACVVQVLEGAHVVTMLFDNGHYMQFTRIRVSAERGTPMFGVECARAVGNMQQFFEIQQAEREIGKVYLCGEFTREDYHICQESMMQMNEKLEVQMLTKDSQEGITFPQEAEFSQYVTAVGALLIAKGRSNLLYQFRHDEEIMQRQRERIGYLLPSALTFAACAVSSATLGMLWFVKADEVAGQYEYMSDLLITQQVAEFEQIKNDSEVLDAAIQFSGDSWRNLDSYPVFSAATRQLIEACAKGLGTVVIVSYEADPGRVKLEVSALEAEHLYQIAGKLEECTDVIDEVIYSGFHYDERDSTWRATVEVCLRGTERQEVAR